MKIFCIGRNYVEHAAELNNPLPAQPLIFSKPPTALLKDNKPFFIPEFTKEVHHELEVVVRVSKNGKHIEEKFARKYYDKYTLGIDFTARDVQSRLKEKGHPWEIAKGFDGSAVIGKWLDLDDNDSLDDLSFRLEVNGDVRQEGTTADMIFPIDRLIAEISTYFTLQTGDLIYTGTPAGVAKVEIGDELKGYIGENELFTCQVR